MYSKECPCGHEKLPPLPCPHPLSPQVQEAAVQDPSFDIMDTDNFIAKFQDPKQPMKRAPPTGANAPRGGSPRDLDLDPEVRGGD